MALRLPITSRAGLQRLVRVGAHVAAWLAVAFLPLAFSPFPGGKLPPDFTVWRLLLPMSLLAGFFYLNYWVLIPRLLARRRFGGYFALIFLICAAFGLPMVLQRVGLISAPPGIDAPRDPTLVVAVVIGLVWLLSSALRITGEWLASEQLRKQLHSDQLAAELAFLKSQVNPHFLFNTLNNVYSLAELKSDDAPAAILKLSQLMRYMLYEADAPRVPLAREITYLRNYIDLQRLRLEPGRAPIGFELAGDPNGHLIEPMLLLPFVENAFKHGISYRHASPIGIELLVSEDGLQLRVHNQRFDEAATAAGHEAAGGVGLANVRKRLALLYPGCHTLQVQPAAHDFTVSLTLTLRDDKVFAGG